MDDDPTTFEPNAQRNARGVRRIELRTILAGAREIIICHGSEEYRLRLTSNDKLLLTK